jgi:hypothetical protein
MSRPRLIRSVLVSLGAVLFIAAIAAAADPYAPTVTMSITPPNGKMQTLDARESETATLKLDNGTEYKFRPSLVDAKPWTQVVVTIFKGATAQSPDQMLGEVPLKTGAPAVASKTNPVFKIGVTKVTAAPNPADKK